MFYKIGQRGSSCFACIAALIWIAPAFAGTERFQNTSLSITLSDRTGSWTSITTRDRLLAAASTQDGVTLSVGGVDSRYPTKLRPTGDSGVSGAQTVGRHWKLIGRTLSDLGEATLLQVTSREGDWQLKVEYRVPRHLTRVERRFSIRYEGSGEAVLRGLQVALPTLIAGADDRIELPGSSVPPSLHLADIDERGLQAGGPAGNILAIRSESSRSSLMYWAYSETELPQMQVLRSDRGVTAKYSVELAARLIRGQEISWGSDYLWLVEGTWAESLAHFQDWWSQVNVQAPRDRPRWTESALIYETQIGAARFSRGQYQFNPYPTVQALIDRLDYIQGLGFNTVQLMPQHPSPGYAVEDYFDPSRQYGQGFERLVEECHKRGLHVIVDWIVHGVIDKDIAEQVTTLVNGGPDEAYRQQWLQNYVLNQSQDWLDTTPNVNPLRALHPDWFVKDINGQLAGIYTWAFDLENEALQTYIIDAMKFYVQKLGVDGFRVDAPDWNTLPNWDRRIEYRASLSETGGIRLLDRAREQLHRLNSDLMLYTEPSSPAFRRMFDVNYSYHELWLYNDLLGWLQPATLPDQSTRHATAQTARVWFHDLRAAAPQGAKTVHQVDSHDSFWWPDPGKKFRREQFGEGGYRALFFAMAMLDGGLMQYPTAELGNEDFVRRVLYLRTSTEEISKGRCYYLLPEISSDTVFAVGWKSQNGWAFPLTNFSNRTKRIRVRLSNTEFEWEPNGRYHSAEILNGLLLNDTRQLTLTGEELRTRGLEVQLEPLQSALIRVSRQ